MSAACAIFEPLGDPCFLVFGVGSLIKRFHFGCFRFFTVGIVIDISLERFVSYRLFIVVGSSLEYLNGAVPLFKDLIGTRLYFFIRSIVSELRSCSFLGFGVPDIVSVLVLIGIGNKYLAGGFADKSRIYRRFEVILIYRLERNVQRLVSDLERYIIGTRFGVRKVKLVVGLHSSDTGDSYRL